MEKKRDEQLRRNPNNLEAVEFTTRLGETDSGMVDVQRRRQDPENVNAQLLANLGDLCPSFWKSKGTWSGARIC